MTTPQPLPSAFRTRVLTNTRIAYLLSDLPTTNNRTYGFMRIPATEASTPHPRLTLRVEDSLLPETREGTTIGTNYGSTIQFDKKTVQRFRSVPPEHMVIGTPHPIKGLALDPQLLKKERHSSLRVTYDTGSVGSKPASILKKSICDIKEKYRMSKKGKKVTLIDPRRGFSLTTIQSSNSNFGSVSELTVIPQTPTSPSKTLSFSERRRLFNADEFTIAKHGRKMSEQIMRIPGQSLKSVEIETTKKDLKAINEINEYIKKHGYVMSHCGVTNVISVVHRKSSESHASMMGAKLSIKK